MTRQSLFAGTAIVALLAGTMARAETKPTLKDRFDQIVSTFLGDSAANVDIDLKHVLDTWRGMHPKPLETISVEEARKQPTPIEAAAALLKSNGKPLDPNAKPAKIVTIDTPAGPIGARIYDAAAAGSDSARPVVVFFHGGGFVTGNAASAEASSRAIAETSGALVVAPDYRLAPEHKFPAAQEDSLAAYKWVLANAASFGGDPDRVALAGEGAGGMLATDTAIAARDEKLAPAAALVLITPAAGVNLKTNSWLEDSTARPWNKDAVAWALRLYLNSETDTNDPRVDLVGKADVHNLPPTTIVTAEDDPLRSDGERMGGKLRIATVPVAMRDYPGMTHDFFGMGAAVEKAEAAQRFVGEALKQAFSPKTGATAALEDMGIAPYPEAADPTAAATPDVMVTPKGPAATSAAPKN